MAKTLRVPSIQFKAFIRAAPGRVYKTLTTGTGWDAWFTSGTEVDLGARQIKLRWRNHGPEHVDYEDNCPIVRARKDRQFTFKWVASAVTKTTVDFGLKPHGKGTMLTLTESGHKPIQQDLDAAVHCAVGWGEAVMMLKFYLEHGATYGPVPK